MFAIKIGIIYGVKPRYGDVYGNLIDPHIKDKGVNALNQVEENFFWLDSSNRPANPPEHTVRE